LKISYETVKEHVQHILRKLSVTDRTQAAVWAVRNKIVANDSIPTQLFGYGQHN
jgi:DNA-binding NarL/FixJ family response regulator